MGLDMLKSQPLRLDESLKRPCLIDNIILNLLEGGIDISPSKPHEVEKSRMGSYPYAVLLCQGDCLSHHPGVPGVESTGDVG